MLDIQNLTMKYGQSQILNTMSLSAKAGEVTAVMGTNGVGKTSLLKVISGRHPYADGTITLIANAINWDGSDDRIDEAYEDAQNRLNRMQRELAAPLEGHIAHMSSHSEPIFDRNISEDEFIAKVGRSILF